MINDNYEGWSGTITMKMMSGDSEKLLDEQQITIEGLGDEQFEVDMTMPDKEGEFAIIASFIDQGHIIASEFEFEVRSEGDFEASIREYENKQFVHDK